MGHCCAFVALHPQARELRDADGAADDAADVFLGRVVAHDVRPRCRRQLSLRRCLRVVEV
jgi:hypothetical protein